MSLLQNQIVLDPEKHTDAAKYFCDYFSLSPALQRRRLLESILENFAHIPYENISKIIKLNQHWHLESGRIRLPEEVIDDHITKRLGGTCFSLTFLLQTVLTNQGFSCYPVMADMRAGKNIHCCLIVILDSVKYLVDPGYLLTQPMAINPQKPKLYRNEFAGIELRSHAASGRYDLFTFDRNETKWRYRFHDRPLPASEFLRHWQASFGWNSMRNICLTKVMKNGMLYIRKDFMRETTFDGKKNFNIKKNYHKAISENFGIDRETVEQARAAMYENRKRHQHKADNEQMESRNGESDRG